MTGIIKPRLDKLGNPLTIPRQFHGREDEFEKLVAELEPHHCSYPSGQPICSKSGKPCRKKKTAEGVCKEHSTELLPLILNNAPIGYVRDKLIAAYKDGRLTDTRPNIAIEEFILSERLDMANNGESRRFIDLIMSIAKRMDEMFRELHEAIADGDTETAGEKIKSLGKASKSLLRAVNGRSKHHNALGELSSANGASIRTKEAASRIAVNEKQVISYDTAVITMRELCETFHNAINTVVSDRAERQQAQQAVSDRMYAIAGRFKPSEN